MVELLRSTTERCQDLEREGAESPTLVLASASPRRRELLTYLGAAYTAIATDAEEQDLPVPAHVLAALPAFPLASKQHPTLLAWRKASHVLDLLPNQIVIGADTIVVLEDEVLNKPRDTAHAQLMLARLSGRVHTVYTGLCVIGTGRPTIDGAVIPATFHQLPTGRRLAVWFDLVASRVEIAPLSAGQINDYVATGEPLDKAGAYGIQGLGGRLVRSVTGSYTAVVGFPLFSAHRLLSAAGVASLHDPALAYHAWLQGQGKEPMPCPPTLP